MHCSEKIPEIYLRFFKELLRLAQLFLNMSKHDLVPTLTEPFFMFIRHVFFFFKEQPR